MELDRIDLQILNLLQEDATITLRRLAEGDGPTIYGTMVKDPDGHTIEVVHWIS